MGYDRGLLWVPVASARLISQSTKQPTSGLYKTNTLFAIMNHNVNLNNIKL